jgi:transposase
VFTNMQLWAEIRRRVLAGELSIRQAATEYDLNFRTVHKIVHQTEPPTGPTLARPRPKPVLDPFLPIIRQILQEDLAAPPKQRHTARRIFDRLKKDHDYTGCQSIVRAAVASLRREQAEVFVPLDHPPAHAQVDFGTAHVRVAGVPYRAALFVLTLVHCNRRFACLAPRECTETFLLGHAAAFAELGGVPRRITYDNSRIAVKGILGAHARLTTPQFDRLRCHFLFEAHFCTVRRAHEKGSVENGVGYVRRNFLVPVPAADSWAELNDRLTQDCQRDFEEQARRTPGQLALLQADRAALLPLPPEPFAAGRVAVVVVNKLSLARFDGNDYSVPSRYAYQSLTACGGLDRVYFLHQGTTVAQHARCWARRQTILDPLHYLAVLETKPGALDHGRPFVGWELPNCFARLRLRLEEAAGVEGTRQYIRVLRLLESHALEAVGAAVERALTLTVCDAAVVRLLLEQVGERAVAGFDLAGRPRLQAACVPVPDLSAYGTLLAAGPGAFEAD